LEAFKASLGFVARAFPSQLVLRWPVGPVLRTFRPAIYRRLLGEDPIAPDGLTAAAGASGDMSGPPA
jgi:hypothetical protein